MDRSKEKDRSREREKKDRDGEKERKKDKDRRGDVRYSAITGKKVSVILVGEGRADAWMAVEAQGCQDEGGQGA